MADVAHPARGPVPAGASAGAEPPPLPMRTLLAYAGPALGLGFTFFLINLYLLKFATDVLLVAPAVMGLVFGLSKAWDAVSDPLAGHLSDRTRSRLGRRRPWLLVSALPFGAAFLALWSVPPSLGPVATATWLAVAVFAFYTASTVFAVPHESLGAELSAHHHERTRLFAAKHVLSGVGMLLAAAGGMGLLVSSDTPRTTVWRLALAASVLTTGLILVTVASLRERPEHQGRGGAGFRSAFADVGRNPHARLLLLVFGIETFGAATLAALVVYVTEYVLRQPHMTPWFLLSYTLPAILFVPLWVRLARPVGKKRLWVFSMAMQSAAFGCLFLVGEGDGAFVCVLGVVAGIGGGCGQVVGPSIQADVIDWDELHTGQRKEGAYFAVWNFVRKLAFGIPPMLVGLTLQVVGYEPNAEQSEATRLALRVLFGLVPACCYIAGTLLFLRFRLDEAEHAAIRAALDARGR